MKKIIYVTTKLSVEIKVSMETLKGFPPTPQSAILELAINFWQCTHPSLKSSSPIAHILASPPPLNKLKSIASIICVSTKLQVCVCICVACTCTSNLYMDQLAHTIRLWWHWDPWNVILGRDQGYNPMPLCVEVNHHPMTMCMWGIRTVCGVWQ